MGRALFSLGGEIDQEVTDDRGGRPGDRGCHGWHCSCRRHGAAENVAVVDGKVTPNKLSKKKFKPVKLFLGVRNSKGQIDGAQSNPASELISFSKNIKIQLRKAPRCTAPLPNGIPTADARAACPPKSYLGAGDGEVTAPGGTVIAEPVSSVFNGPGKNEVRLHTYSPDLGPASPIVDGRIVNSPINGFGQALRVPQAPETGAVMITKFNASLLKARKVAMARCKSKKIKFQRDVRYADDSAEFAQLTQRCKRR